ncbi:MULTISPECIES: XRE family transcriptional regulator [Neptunomonas]|uniref:Helix-turn-helix transcriptional regulator n=1 Tax=Neptunomonas marina TaxID=1815562 RepID=A0A437QDQ5_9GAMM|nr:MULTISPECIES: helix-turn-helix transcriptional regulator [Neptunomonas]RVU32688.1 helix-turn-helix transcriptional regulator [Neptunomonas marina]
MEKTISARIAQRMEALGLSQAALARKAGINRASVSHWLLGNNKPSGDSLIKLAAGLECSVEWLQTGIGENDRGAVGLGLDSSPLGLDSNGGTVPTPIYDVEFAAGFGADAGLESEPEYLQIPAYYYTESGVFPGDGMIVTVRGDSMERTFYNGDKLMIDKSQTKPINDAVFAFNLEGDLRVKRFFRKLDGTWKISSDNKDDPAYEDEIISPDRLQFINIIGQVVALVHRPIRRI